jgi:hypothetical protein
MNAIKTLTNASPGMSDTRAKAPFLRPEASPRRETIPVARWEVDPPIALELHGNDSEIVAREDEMGFVTPALRPVTLPPVDKPCSGSEEQALSL